MCAVNSRKWVVLVLILIFLPNLSQAEAESDPLCGKTVTADLVLDHDVVCYKMNGLTIGTEGITIDLNGKEIRCKSGRAADCRGGGFVGIDASKVSHVVIQGPGTVAGFDVLLVKGDGQAKLQPTRVSHISSQTRKKTEHPK
jgi:hypothetical protein